MHVRKMSKKKEYECSVQVVFAGALAGGPIRVAVLGDAGAGGEEAALACIGVENDNTSSKF